MQCFEVVHDDDIAMYRHAYVCAVLVSNLYPGHSLRRGAAAIAASVGIPQHIIQALARWATASSLLPLEKRIKQLEDELFELKLAHDDLATFDRRADLRFYGLPEQDGEDTCQLIIQTCASIGVLQSIGDQIDQLLDD
ncbi:unnamed protein product [Didymodactylos carnosus]|uniref:Uncharacterized protein n=1 Tax=Didymodactylos carnosus TaxID=1234261 RepID=A0A814H6Q6_9BILA|nr:unnamed protein product [Didymodactylos carnosus]CAF3777791.1 unnamed protein product [Didymodactylos carnosus]